ncbi:glycosyltransferase family 1 protein [Plantibacter sp. T3]|uniref:rhamnosyltransferase WsaF family glycosyltransferase n=1 Tax=Plantibacter sp. T3 TaxID=2653161 RepID=UPI0012F2D8B8|nr:glycosyltransferase family 1 protein [Plantibacter sp. T3]VXC42542.1 conserved hypothetical protein [Plantibacter sp. T3]
MSPLSSRLTAVRTRAARVRTRAARLLRFFKDLGPKAFLGRVFSKLSTQLSLQNAGGEMLVNLEHAAAVDWTVPGERFANPVTVADGPVRMAWIMSPPGAESGGHQNLFRFIDFAERAGHHCTIYLYDNLHLTPSLDATKQMLAASKSYPDLNADIRMYDASVGVDADTQALFATGWETAYASYLDRSTAKRFYFVQDFEPYFYAIGSEYILAENTYRFGFHGITAGGWLAHKLSTEYGMACDSFDFSVDTSLYRITNERPRNEIFFYARPVTSRRAFELGVLALKDFSELKPDVTINLAGWDVSGWDLPFAYKNHSSMQLAELNELYNRCAAGLVLSLTNMSLLPLELISSGVAPVVNDGPNNRMVSDNPFIEYVPPVPMALARTLAGVFDRPDATARGLAMSASVAGASWSDSGDAFVSAVERVMRG